MCGICGFTGKNVPQEAVLMNMMERIVHRGPDGAGSYIDEDIALGFRRLAIIDLDHGSQPMTNESGDLVVTFNGEIYNYREIRQELLDKGHVFANQSDTECLIHGFEEYGEKILEAEALTVWQEDSLFRAEITGMDGLVQELVWSPRSGKEVSHEK